jgi:hypothetical protein
MDSSVVVFENSELVAGKIIGGNCWKACIQRGVGSQFSRVYLDSTSTTKLVNSLKVDLESRELISMVGSLIEDVNKGMPRLADAWIEFPGYLNNNLDKYRNLIEKGRLSLPSVSLFQKAFTSAIQDLDGRIGPIDFFDSIDALMVLAISNPERRGLATRTIAVKNLVDEGDYVHKHDPRIVPRIENANIPFVTVASSLLAVHILRKMYESDGFVTDGGYDSSLRRADDIILDTIG